MHTKLDHSKFTQAALAKIGQAPKPQPSQVDVGTIIWCKLDHDQPLMVECSNGVIFRCGGLTQRQRDQIPSLLPDLFGCQMVFCYEALNEHGQPVDARFKTLLLAGDQRFSEAMEKSSCEAN